MWVQGVVSYGGCLIVYRVVVSYGVQGVGVLWCPRVYRVVVSYGVQGVGVLWWWCPMVYRVVVSYGVQGGVLGCAGWGCPLVLPLPPSLPL